MSTDDDTQWPPAGESDADLVSRNLKQHELVPSVIARIARFASELQLAQSNHTAWQSFGEELAALRERLQAHFYFEETGGLYGRLSELLPEHRDELSTLGQDHKDVLGLIDSISSKIAEGPKQDLGPMRSLLDEVVCVLGAHEMAESNFLRIIQGKLPD